MDMAQKFEATLNTFFLLHAEFFAQSRTEYGITYSVTFLFLIIHITLSGELLHVEEEFKKKIVCFAAFRR